MDQRMSKDKYYLNIADAVLDRSTCLRRKYGAIIVKNDEIISTGYNGSPRGRKNCVDMGFCTREAASGELLHDTTSCAMCRRMIINSGITRVVNRIGDDGIEIIDVLNWIVNDESIQPKAEAE